MDGLADMPTHIAMLRGINVSGHKRIKMSQLQAMFEALGFKQVKTYIQSGNVVFEAGTNSAPGVSRKIEEKILSGFGFSVAVISKTPAELCETIQNNPFLKKRGVDLSRLHVTFLAKAPAAAALKKLEALNAGPDQWQCRGSEIYLYCPDGYGRTKLSNTALERMLSVTATTRNWRTVNQLYQMALERS
jgi:uncharacterized protein (DUF1697 family)